MFNAALEPAPNNICSVLLVDDNVEFCELLKDYLSDYGFSLCFAHDGASGINTLEKIKLMGEECNLVLLDLFLPDLSTSLRHKDESFAFILASVPRKHGTDGHMPSACTGYDGFCCYYDSSFRKTQVIFSRTNNRSGQG